MRKSQIKEIKVSNWLLYSPIRKINGTNPEDVSSDVWRSMWDDWQQNRKRDHTSPRLYELLSDHINKRIWMTAYYPWSKQVPVCLMKWVSVNFTDDYVSCLAKNKKPRYDVSSYVLPHWSITGNQNVKKFAPSQDTGFLPVEKNNFF